MSNIYKNINLKRITLERLTEIDFSNDDDEVIEEHFIDTIEDNSIYINELKASISIRDKKIKERKDNERRK